MHSGARQRKPRAKRSARVRCVRHCRAAAAAATGLEQRVLELSDPTGLGLTSARFGSARHRRQSPCAPNRVPYWRRGRSGSTEPRPSPVIWQCAVHFETESRVSWRLFVRYVSCHRRVNRRARILCTALCGTCPATYHASHASHGDPCGLPVARDNSASAPPNG